MDRERRVVFVLFEEVGILDVTGPMTVFWSASRLLPRGAGYRVELASPGGRPVTTIEGMRVAPERALEAIEEVIDTLVVPGRGGTPPLHADPALVEAVRRLGARARRVASVCTGAFLLAEAGLLAGKRVATHWAACQLLRQRHPECEVDDDALFLRGDTVWTAAGVTSGIDLALQLVEDDHGQEIAAKIARWLVVYLRRAGGQNQFSALSFGERSSREPLRELGAWVAEHLRGDLSLDRLAARVGMSRRNLTRVFRQEMGVSPAAYVERVRIEAACRALETTQQPLKRIADSVGFGTTESMHRAFKRRLSLTPGEYRARFAGEGGSPRAT